MKKLGYALILISVLFFFVLFSVPFWSMPLAQKGIISTILLVVGEVSFWVGGILLGKEIISKLKSKYNFRNLFKKQEENIEPDK